MGAVNWSKNVQMMSDAAVVIGAVGSASAALLLYAVGAPVSRRAARLASGFRRGLFEHVGALGRIVRVPQPPRSSRQHRVTRAARDTGAAFSLVPFSWPNKGKVPASGRNPDDVFITAQRAAPITPYDFGRGISCSPVNIRFHVGLMMISFTHA